MTTLEVERLMTCDRRTLSSTTLSRPTAPDPEDPGGGRARAKEEINGATLHPEAAYLLLRGMKTLALRVERQNETALRIARHLRAHPMVEQVFYPGLEEHHHHEVARRQMPGGFGGMLSFVPQGGWETVERFLPRLRLAHRAANLGAVETVVAPPRTGSHVELTAEERAALGIPEALVRYSCGIEDAGDLIADIDAALAATLRSD